MPAQPVRHRSVIYRHPLLIRLTHWINVLCMALLLMSGLQIFNAHSALYWGDISDFDHPLAAIFAAPGKDGSQAGMTRVFGHTFETTGVLGLSKEDGRSVPRGFPSWATIPSYQDLATGRRWHFFFAWLLVINGAVYILYSLLSRHAWRDLVPTRDQLAHIGRSIIDHLRLRFPSGEEARHYNVLQKLSYLVVIFVLVPVMVLAGLALSPQMDASWPWLTALFGGRQAARTVHFIVATALLAFALVHVLMVLLSGVWNNLRSMITGRYVIEESPDHGRSDRAH
jgi:thiosulfate reductase cytochrome b subunit